MTGTLFIIIGVVGMVASILSVFFILKYFGKKRRNIHKLIEE